MTIYDTSVPYFVAALYRDYLSHASSRAMGVPETVDSGEPLPINVMDLGVTPALPSVVISAREDNSAGARRVVGLSIMLLTWLKTDAEAVDEAHPDEAPADFDEQTTSEEASRIIGAIDRRIRQMESTTIDDVEIPGFRDWMASLSDERLAGWRIIKIVPNGMPLIQRNREKRTIFHASTAEVHIRLVREAA